MHDDADARRQAFDVAGRALTRRDHSVAQLRERLLKTADAEVGEAVIADLERIGYLDDERLALALAERRLDAGWGPARVEADLAALQIVSPAAMSLAEELAAPAAKALLQSRHAVGKSLSRRYALLARRGFSEELCVGLLDPRVGCEVHD